MRPDARAQSAIELLDQWLTDQTSLDRILTKWARANRYAGSGDRAAIADLTYGAVRRMRSASWVAGTDKDLSGRGLIYGCAVLDGQNTDTIFTGARYAPSPLTPAEISACQGLNGAPSSVRYDYPDWLKGQLASVQADDLDALRSRASLDLRVNTLKATTKQATDALAEEDITVTPLPHAVNALRVESGNRRIMRSKTYERGLVEIQDAGSQALAALADAKPGELIIDLCAGGGGKALALAAAADGKARIIAHDISTERLSDLPVRAARAGARIEVAKPNELQSWQGKADLVFVDAPCSGSGAWRRNPDAKWLFSEKRLQTLHVTQSSLINEATKLCKPSGRVVYGTCSILNTENEDIVEAFLAHTTDWQLLRTHKSLLRDGTDGLFGAVLSR